jgi:hypothetical protein
MFKNKQWLQAIIQAIIAALTALLTAFSATSCIPGLAPAL